MTKRDELKAALAKAEAALANAVINAAKVDGDPAKANAKLDKARANCRRIRVALIELDDSELIAWSRKWINTPTKQSGEDLNEVLARVRLRDHRASTLFAVKTKNHNMNSGRERQFTGSVLVSRRRTLSPEMRAQGHPFYGRPSVYSP